MENALIIIELANFYFKECVVFLCRFSHVLGGVGWVIYLGQW